MIRIITVEREYGSQGAEYAQQLARRLNWKLIDHCLIEDIARKAGVSSEQAEALRRTPGPVVLPGRQGLLARKHRAHAGHPRRRRIRQRELDEAGR